MGCWRIRPTSDRERSGAHPVAGYGTAVSVLSWRCVFQLSAVSIIPHGLGPAHRLRWLCLGAGGHFRRRCHVRSRTPRSTKTQRQEQTGQGAGHQKALGPQSGSQRVILEVDVVCYRAPRKYESAAQGRSQRLGPRRFGSSLRERSWARTADRRWRSPKWHLRFPLPPPAVEAKSPV